jgi:cytochrome c1
MMNAKRSLFTCLAALTLGATLAAAPVHAADKTYQVTGPVLEVTDTTVTVQKGKEKWQLARNKDTKVTGDLKVGAKVTIEYTMTAVSIEAKGDGKAAAAKPAADAKAGEAKPAAAKK